MKEINDTITRLHNRVEVPTLGYRVIGAHGHVYERVGLLP